MSLLHHSVTYCLITPRLFVGSQRRTDKRRGLSNHTGSIHRQRASISCTDPMDASHVRIPCTDSLLGFLAQIPCLAFMYRSHASEPSR